MTLFSVPTWWVSGVHWTACFFVLVISFTLSLETFLSSIDALREPDDLCDDLSSIVVPLDDEFFLLLIME